MQDFIVLGLIPGTQTQFDFRGWSLFCASLVLLFLLFAVRKLSARKAIRVRILSWYAARLIGQQDSPLLTNLK